MENQCFTRPDTRLFDVPPEHAHTHTHTHTLVNMACQLTSPTTIGSDIALGLLTPCEFSARTTK